MAVGARHYVMRIGDHTLGTISDLAVSSVGDGTATLTWTAPANATSLQPQRRLTGSGSWTNIGNALSGSAETVQPSGLVNGNSYDFRVVASDGTNVTYSNTATGTPSAGASLAPPTAPTVGDANLVFDTRSGGSQDIQAAGVEDLGSALSVMSAGYKNGSSGGYTIYPLDFTANYDGSSTHAYRFNWTYHAGYTGPDPCYNANGEQNSMIYFNRDLSLGSGTYVQWKTWFGQTASGGGLGSSTVGSFSNGGGHKLLIIFRAGDIGNAHRLYFGYNGDNGLAGAIGASPEWTQNGVNFGSIEGYLNGAPVNLDTYNNQIVTFTLYFEPESSAGAGDGTYKAWINDTLLWDLSPMPMGTLNLGEQQFGGPTWICPPQDQTQYMWDFVEWSV